MFSYLREITLTQSLRQYVLHNFDIEFGSPRPVHSDTSRRERVKLVSLSCDETCNGVNRSRRGTTNSEVDGRWDVRDADWLFLVVDEQAQRARRCVEVGLQHHCRSFTEFPVSSHKDGSVPDISTVAVTKREEMRGGKGRRNS
jgi:hypothetical protein